jgi:thiamine-monophosphate kinase
MIILNDCFRIIIIINHLIIKNMFEDKDPELTPISKLGEFGLIKHLTEHFPYPMNLRSLVGDDAAVINPEIKK